MKCITCQTDNNLKDRTANNGRCKQCQHPFVFEPTTMGTTKITDPMFAKAIADVSANDTLYFTPRQLFYLLDKRFRRKASEGAIGCLVLIGFLTVFPLAAAFSEPGLFVIPGIINILGLISLYSLSRNQAAPIKARQRAASLLQLQGVFILVIGMIVGLVTNLYPVLAFAIIFGLLALYLGKREYKVQANTAPKTILEPTQFEDWMNRWHQVNPIAKLLPTPKENALPAALNPDVTAYSFDRLVVTDSAAIAQLLIANNFHFENNCAVLSITGYPQSIFQTTMEMLKRNPELKIYAFHDCSGKGLTLVHHLKTSPKWFANNRVEIFDVGLIPRQILSSVNILIQRSPERATEAKQLPAPVRQQLTADELAWLEEGNYVTLETFTPQRLIQVLHRGIAVSRSESAGSDLLLVGDSGSSYYAIDSFG